MIYIRQVCKLLADQLATPEIIYALAGAIVLWPFTSAGDSPPRLRKSQNGKK
jgi:hypothetical protein